MAGPILLLGLLAAVLSPWPRGHAQAKPLGIAPYCNAAVSESDLRSLEHSQIMQLEVVISNARKWAKNNFKILRSRSEIILPKHKKRFDGTITAHYANGLTCSFGAKIRQSGDWKDHIQFVSGQFINSLDVKLTDSHIGGIVRFKLLIPSTREGQNEVIVTNLLRATGFLAPRTAMVKVDLMGQRTEMIFQEKQRKEMLEDNFLREGPLLEGDERFTWATSQIQGDAKTFNDSLVLSKLLNNRWAARGPSSLQISKDAARRLNVGFIKHGYLRFGLHEENAGTYFDNALLANGDPAFLRHLNAYNALLQAANAGHALRPHNRIFYYDPMYGRFHPIYYDGMPKLGRLTRPGFPAFFGISKFAVDGAPEALRILQKLDLGAFAKRLNQAGLAMTADQVQSVVQRLKDNLVLVGELKLPDYSSIPVPSTEKYLEAVRKAKKHDVWLLRFATQDAGGNCDLCRAEACHIEQGSCRPITLDAEETSELLSGNFKLKKQPTLFIEADERPAADIQGDKMSKLSAGLGSGVEVISSPGMKVVEDAAARTVTFQQDTSNDWAMLRGGSLDGVKLIFKGAPKREKPAANAQRFNRQLLTGCLTLLDMSVNKLGIVVNEGGCEDGVNLVRVKGHIDTIKVSHTVADAIDLDFSEISFGMVDVTDADNDCIDFSSGRYEIRSMRAKNCGDKGISVGEGTRLTVGHARIDGAVTGVAVKDSSRFSAQSIQVRNAKTCISAYRKKQEFSGGFAKIAESDCGGAGIRADPGSAVMTKSGS